jgi:hypothetical protein
MNQQSMLMLFLPLPGVARRRSQPTIQDLATTWVPTANIPRLSTKKQASRTASIPALAKIVVAVLPSQLGRPFPQIRSLATGSSQFQGGGVCFKRLGKLAHTRAGACLRTLYKPIIPQRCHLLPLSDVFCLRLRKLPNRLFSKSHSSTVLRLPAKSFSPQAFSG